MRSDAHHVCFFVAEAGGPIGGLFVQKKGLAVPLYAALGAELRFQAAASGAIQATPLYLYFE